MKNIFFGLLRGVGVFCVGLIIIWVLTYINGWDWLEKIYDIIKSISWFFNL